VWPHLLTVAMKNFLVGLAIGVPTGMLLGDHRQAIRERIRKLVRRDLRGVTDTDGGRIAAAVNRIAEHARERAGKRHENEGWRKTPA
jgi:hypothetical protein